MHMQSFTAICEHIHLCTYIYIHMYIYTYIYYVPWIIHSQYNHHNNKNSSISTIKMTIRSMMKMIHHGKQSINRYNFNCKNIDVYTYMHNNVLEKSVSVAKVKCICMWMTYICTTLVHTHDITTSLLLHVGTCYVYL